MRLPFPVVLASGSPRRYELLSKIVSDFEVEVSDVDEESLTVEDPWETAQGLAEAKALAVADARALRQAPAAIVIGGDTVVALPGPVMSIQLAKPMDEDDAIRMLKFLSGRRHAVITGLAVVSPYGVITSVDTSWVTFRELSELEIRAYVASGEPMDKAGSYAIQGGAQRFLEKLEGDIETVVGLSTSMLQTMLNQVIETLPPNHLNE